MTNLPFRPADQASLSIGRRLAEAGWLVPISPLGRMGERRWTIAGQCQPLVATIADAAKPI